MPCAGVVVDGFVVGGFGVGVVFGTVHHEGHDPAVFKGWEGQRIWICAGVVSRRLRVLTGQTTRYRVRH